MPPFSFYVGERKLMTHSRSHELYDLESHALISFKRSNPYLPPSRGVVTPVSSGSVLSSYPSALLGSRKEVA
jgi:hypothetical protein